MINNTYINKTTRKNPNIELLRIIACMMVIGCHTYLWYVDANGKCLSTRLMFAMLCANGVAIFWFITGFFFFNNNSYKKTVIKNIQKIIVPMFVIGLFAFYIGDWLTSDKTLAESIHHTANDYLHIVSSIMKFGNPFRYMEPTWYVYVFMIVIFTYPVWKQLVLWLDEDNNRTKYFMIISVLTLIINDMTCNQLAEFAHHSIRGAIPAALFIIWGHIIFNSNQKQTYKKYRWWGLAGFFAFAILGFLIQKIRYDSAIMDNSIMYWFSTIGLFATVCIVIFVLNIKIPSQIKPLICIVGDCTFGIYLIHALVIAILRQRFKLMDRIYNVYISRLPLNIAEILYNLSLILIILSISFIIVVIFKIIKNLIIK